MDILKLLRHEADTFFKNYEAYAANRKAQFHEICSFEDLAYMAYLQVSLFRLTGDEARLSLALRALTDMGQFSDDYIAWHKAHGVSSAEKQLTLGEAIRAAGRPFAAPMDGMFRPTYYLLAYLAVSDRMDDGQKLLCQKAVSRSLPPIAAYTDWGPQNRGLIKGFNLRLFAKAFPHAEEAAHYDKLGLILCEESFNQWSIEDAQIYIPVWMHTLLHYQAVFGDESYFSQPMVRYYFEYMRDLMAPNGVIPDFGDARWMNSAEAYACCLEKAAVLYGDGRMRYAAGRIWEAVSTPESSYVFQPRHAGFLADLLLWRDEGISPVPFEIKSGEILDDLVGKKYRLSEKREGTDHYLMLNYRDEGDYGWLARNYIRNTIFVNHEKTHHGHCDENAIILMLAGQSVLLHDAGYRETGVFEPGWPKGTYRSDFFHNKLVARRGILMPGVDFIDYCAAEPTYNKVRSEKIFFETFHRCDAARTRVYDDKHGLQSDRTIVLLKDSGCYVVLDTVTAYEEGEYTFAPLYFTSIIKELGKGLYDTKLTGIACDEPKMVYENDPTYSLAVLFPDETLSVKQTSLRRSYAEEMGLYQLYSGRLTRGETRHIFTVLYPHAADTAPNVTAKLLPVPDGRGAGIEVMAGGHRHTLALRDAPEDRMGAGFAYPAYQFEGAKVSYGALCTDAAFAHLYHGASALEYETILFTRIDYENKTLFEVPQTTFIQADHCIRPGRSLFNKWFGECKNG